MKKISLREKRLIAVAVAAVALFLVFQFALSPILAYYDRMGKEIPQLRDDLLTARRVKKRYGEIAGDVKAVQERLAARPKEFNAHDFLSTLARREGVLPNLDDITKKTEQVNEAYQEETATVKLKKVSLGKLVSYLYGIENSGQLLTVRELEITPDRGNSLLLDVAFEASTFRQSEAKEEDRKSETAPQRKGRPKKS